MIRKHRNNKTPAWKVILCILFLPFVIYYYVFKLFVALIKDLCNYINRDRKDDAVELKQIPPTNYSEKGNDTMKRALKWVAISILIAFIIAVILMIIGFEDAGGTILAAGIFLSPAIAIVVVLVASEFDKSKGKPDNKIYTEPVKLINTNNTLPENIENENIHPVRKEPTPEDILEEIDVMDGWEFEEFVGELLKNIGYYNVEVTPGSGDYGVDVLAEMNGVRYAFQCKCYSSPLGLKPIQEVNAGKYHYKAHVGVVVTNSTFTPAAVEIAEDTGVLLWDRNKLIHEIALMSRMKSL